MHLVEKVFITAAAFSLPLTAVAQTSLSFAAPVDSAEAHFTSVWNAYGVPSSTQASLLHDWEATHSWDSLEGGAPVSTRAVDTRDGASRVSTFADGSITVESLEDSEASTGPDSRADLRNCRDTGASAYAFTRTCVVHTNVVVADFQFTVQFYAVKGGNTTINSVSHLTDSCYGGSCSNQSARIVKKVQSGTTAAKAQGSLEYNVFGGVGSQTFDLNFSVKNGTTSVSNN